MTELRQHIIDEIRRLAKENGGQPPGQRSFEAQCGISRHSWYGTYWSKWGEALAEAGYTANAFGAATTDRSFVLRKVAEAYRYFKQPATDGQLRLFRHKDAELPTTKTISRHFPTKLGMIEALREWLPEQDGAFDDVLAMLPPPAASKPVRVAKPTDGSVYLIQSGKHFKIGRSDQLERRVKEIRTALPDAAILAHTIVTDDPPGIEAYWHRRFADRRANGEWFALTPADVLAFKRRKFQ